MSRDYGTLLSMNQAAFYLKALTAEGYVDAANPRLKVSTLDRDVLHDMLAYLLLGGRAVIADEDGAVSDMFDLSKAESEGLVELVKVPEKSERSYDALLSTFQYGKNAENKAFDDSMDFISIEAESESVAINKRRVEESLEASDNYSFALNALAEKKHRFSETANVLKAVWPAIIDEVFSYYYSTILDLAPRTCAYGARSLGVSECELDQMRKLYKNAEDNAATDFRLASYLRQTDIDTSTLLRHSISPGNDYEVFDFVGNSIVGDYSLEDFCAQYAYIRTIRDIERLAILADETGYSFAKSRSIKAIASVENDYACLNELDGMHRVYRMSMELSMHIPHPESISDVLFLRDDKHYDNFIAKLREWATLSNLSDAEQAKYMKEEIEEAVRRLGKSSHANKTARRIVSFSGVVSDIVGFVEPISGVVLSAIEHISPAIYKALSNHRLEQYRWLDINRDWPNGV